MAVPSLTWAEAAACLDDPRFSGEYPRGIAGSQHRARLLAVCSGCPVLAGCRAWAANYTWSATVVAGWSAPDTSGLRPPWARTTRRAAA